jgi:hypothetical protein
MMINCYVEGVEMFERGPLDDESRLQRQTEGSSLLPLSFQQGVDVTCDLKFGNKF